MDQKEIHEIWMWASQPLENSWRNWVALLRGKPGVTEEDLLRYKPSLNVVLEPLLGRQVVQKATKEGEKDKFFCILPLPKERVRIYKLGLDIACEFGQVEDLLKLAEYRRQVTNVGGLEEIDRPYYEMMKANTKISKEVLAKIIQRMPPRSALKAALVVLLEEPLQPLALAAE